MKPSSIIALALIAVAATAMPADVAEPSKDLSCSWTCLLAIGECGLECVCDWPDCECCGDCAVCLGTDLWSECCSCVGLCAAPPTPASLALAAQPVKAPISDAEIDVLIDAGSKVHPAHMASFHRRLNAIHGNRTRAAAARSCGGRK